MAEIILASTSAIRRKILADAGVAFEARASGVDESAIKDQCTADGASIPEMAAALSRAKALAVEASSAALVIGGDQILECDGRAYDKPADMAEARARLRLLQGRAHRLVNAVAVAKDGALIWETTDTASLFIRPLTDQEIDAYCEAAGPEILSSVGAYQIEKLGARLFDRIDGDYFAALGLGLFPLLGFLRAQGALDF